MATYTFTPYNTSSDGYFVKVGDPWSDVHDATAATAITNNLTTNKIKSEYTVNVYVGGATGPARTAYIYRAYLVFDTAPTIADDEEILGGRIKLYMTPYFDWVEDATVTYTCALVAADFANDLSLTTNDYNDFGTDLLSDQVSFVRGDGTAARWATFTLNAAGLAKIVKTAGTYTAFGLRMKIDIDDAEPPTNEDYEYEVSFVSKRSTNTALHPVLEVDYPGPTLKVYNGTDWVKAHLKRYNGTTWEDAVLKYYDGDSFESVDVSG